MNNQSKNKLLDDYTSHTEYTDNDKPSQRSSEISYTCNRWIKVICVCGLVFVVWYWGLV